LRGRRGSINRPTIPMADYVAAKNAAAARAPGQAKPAAPPSTGVSLYAQVGSTNGENCCVAPNGDIATSANWMVQVNNDAIVMLNWFTNAFVSKNLNTFFQNGTDLIFDPRVIYDPNWDRFVVLSGRCNPCSGAGQSTTYFFLAVSRTGDPSGAWWVFPPGNAAAVGDFADFPQLGMDLNSLIFTYNDFKWGGGLDARTFAIAKAYLYNGRGANYPVFGGSSCTMAPPYVLDNSGVDYVITICPGGNVVWIASLTNTGLSNVNQHLWANVVSVGNPGIPPQAVQPGITIPSTPATTGSRTAHCRSAAGS
jgi:hypothetical protein